MRSLLYQEEDLDIYAVYFLDYQQTAWFNIKNETQSSVECEFDAFEETKFWPISSLLQIIWILAN